MNGDEAYKSNLRKLIFVYLTMWRLENFRFYKRIASTLHHDTISKTLISAGELAISKDRGTVCRELKTSSPLLRGMACDPNHQSIGPG